jgi:peptidoglycan hydrolase-like protein with peptidoglycan-binding domain
VAAGVPSGGGDGEVDKGVIVFTAGPPVVVPAPQSGGNGPIVGSGFGPTTVGIAAGGSSTEPSQTFALVSVPTSTPTSAGEAIHPEEHAGVVAGVSTFKFLTNMGYDSRLTPDVHELHAILIQEGYLHISAPTGYFGPLTFAAVKRYQQAHGIMRSGYVGITTRESLNAR